MYATTTTITPPQVRKINIGGSDVLYGSYDFRDGSILANNSLVTQIFCDVTVDKYNNMLIIDRQYGRVYEYDERGNNLFAFGTEGTGYGQLTYPVIYTHIFFCSIVSIVSLSSIIWVISPSDSSFFEWSLYPQL